MRHDVFLHQTIQKQVDRQADSVVRPLQYSIWYLAPKHPVHQFYLEPMPDD